MQSIDENIEHFQDWDGTNSVNSVSKEDNPVQISKNQPGVKITINTDPGIKESSNSKYQK